LRGRGEREKAKPKGDRESAPPVCPCPNPEIPDALLDRLVADTRAHWLSIEWLPKYAPELNDIETVWRDLKAHDLAHQTFTDTDILDKAIHHAVETMNLERKPNPLVNQRISA
jgi:hypothetical protein